MTVSEPSQHVPAPARPSARLLVSGLLYGGLAALAAGTPGPLSSPALWVCGVLTALAAGHAALTLMGGLSRPRPASAERAVPQTQVRPAVAPTWSVPVGWQAGFHEGRPMLTRPDGRVFLVTDRAVAAPRGMTALWWQPDSGAPPRWVEGVWQVGGQQADVLALAEAL